MGSLIILINRLSKAKRGKVLLLYWFLGGEGALRPHPMGATESDMPWEVGLTIMKVLKKLYIGKV